MDFVNEAPHWRVAPGPKSINSNGRTHYYIHIMINYVAAQPHIFWIFWHQNGNFLGLIYPHLFSRPSRKTQSWAIWQVTFVNPHIANKFKMWYYTNITQSASIHPHNVHNNSKQVGGEANTSRQRPLMRQEVYTVFNHRPFVMCIHRRLFDNLHYRASLLQLWFSATGRCLWVFSALQPKVAVMSLAYHNETKRTSDSGQGWAW